MFYGIAVKTFKKPQAGLFIIGLPFGEIQTDACQSMGCPVTPLRITKYASTFSLKPNVPGVSWFKYAD